MVAYTVTDGTNTYPLAELEISYTGTDLDEAQFSISGTFALDTAITIYADTTAQFVGYVKEMEQIEEGYYKFTAYEKAVELKTMPYLSSTLDIFTKSSITIYNLANNILTSSPDSGWDLASGLSDSTVVTVNFYMVNRLQALNKILREMRGYYVIFDSSAKTVKFLSSTGINTDRTGTDIIYNTKTINSSSMLRGITQVVVIGKDSSIRGTAGSSTSSRAYYQVDDITTTDEANKIAESILADVGVLYATYKITVDPDQIQYDIRDKVTVDGSDYWITSLVQGIDDIELIVDDGRTSVIDSLGSRIHLIEGNFPSGSDASWSGGNTNVAANAAAYTEYKLEIQDITLISGAKFKATIGSFIKSADVSTATDNLSASSPSTTFGTAGSTSTPTMPIYIPSESGFSNGIMNTGYQFGLCNLCMDVTSDTSGNVICYVEYKYGNSSTWNTSTSTSVYVRTAGTWYTVGLSWIFSGVDTAETGSTEPSWRVRLYQSGALLKTVEPRISISRIPRHTHPVTTTYDKTTTGTPPTSITFKINSGSDTTFTPGTTDPVDIQSLLITGTNTIYIKTPSGAGNQCSVNPTITYQTLGKS